MFPVYTSDYGADGLMGKAVFLAEELLLLSAGAALLSYLPYVFFCYFGPEMTLSFWLITPTLLLAIHVIVMGSSGKKVRRVNARWIVAVMAHVESIYVHAVKFCHNSVGHYLTHDWLKISVTSSVHAPIVSPQPARIGIRFFIRLVKRIQNFPVRFVVSAILGAISSSRVFWIKDGSASCATSRSTNNDPLPAFPARFKSGSSDDLDYELLSAQATFLGYWSHVFHLDKSDFYQYYTINPRVCQGGVPYPS